MNGSNPNTRHISCKEKATSRNSCGSYKGAVLAGTKIDQCNFDEYFFLAVPLLKGQLSDERQSSATPAKEIGAGRRTLFPRYFECRSVLGLMLRKYWNAVAKLTSASENQSRYQRNLYGKNASASCVTCYSVS